MNHIAPSGPAVMPASAAPSVGTGNSERVPSGVDATDPVRALLGEPHRVVDAGRDRRRVGAGLELDPWPERAVGLDAPDRVGGALREPHRAVAAPRDTERRHPLGQGELRELRGCRRSGSGHEHGHGDQGEQHGCGPGRRRGARCERGRRTYHVPGIGIGQALGAGTKVGCACDLRLPRAVAAGRPNGILRRHERTHRPHVGPADRHRAGGGAHRAGRDRRGRTHRRRRGRRRRPGRRPPHRPRRAHAAARPDGHALASDRRRRQRAGVRAARDALERAGGDRGRPQRARARSRPASRPCATSARSARSSTWR